MKKYLIILSVILLSTPLMAQQYLAATDETTNAVIKFTVVDTEGNPIQDAQVILYDAKQKWRIDSARMHKPYYTDVNGEVEIDSLPALQYWFNVRKNYATNKFTVTNTETVIDTNNATNIMVPIRDLSQNEFSLCGLCDNKTWITDSIVIFGISQPYDADSKLLSDGTWYDSNGNHGFWWFNEDESTLTYDYDTTSNNGGGSSLDAELIELTDTSFVGEMSLIGLPATYYMSAVYDTINLSLSVQDTTLNLDSNGEALLTVDDLMIEANYCFTCTITLSQTVFSGDDVGNVEVYVTREDRCGNQVVDTITVTIIPFSSIDEITPSQLKIYPNPANDFIVLESTGESILCVEMFDISGRLVKKTTVNTEQYTLQVPDLNPGIYFIRISSSRHIVVRKIVVE